MTVRLARTAKEIWKLSPKDWVLFNSLIAFYRITGQWKFPVPTNGDFEFMKRSDIIYWLHKAERPVTRATQNSGLEAFFDKQMALPWKLPIGFTAKQELSISAVGDLLDHPFLPHSSEILYEQIADPLFGADLTMGNLECVIYPQGSGSFVITNTQAPPLYFKEANFKAIKGYGGQNFSFVATANNHSLDCGEDGVETTARALRAEGIAFNGTNETEDTFYSGTILEKKGFKIGVISHTFGLNAKKPPKDKPWIVNRTHLNGKIGEIDFSQIEKQIAHCRKKSVDVIIGQLHWGLEHEFYPRPYQLETAHHLAELGLDIVIGHHPHVVQPMECYRTRRDPDRVVPIFYSLGNMITSFLQPASRLGGLAQITLAKGTDRAQSQKTYIKKAQRVETFQEVDESKQKIRLVLKTRETLKEILRELN